MSNMNLKNVPNMTLEMVIKRRKTTLKRFVQDAGVQTYAGLITLCERLGIKAVDEKMYINEINPPQVTSQQDGIVVVGPIDSEPMLVDDSVLGSGWEHELHNDPPKKQKRAKKVQNDPTNDSGDDK